MLYLLPLSTTLHEGFNCNLCVFVFFFFFLLEGGGVGFNLLLNNWTIVTFELNICIRWGPHRDFRWDGSGELCVKIRNLVALGIRSLDSPNKDLAHKWLWRFAYMQDNFWRKMIAVKYRKVEGGWSSRESRDVHRLSLWKAIRKGGKDFFSRTSSSIGNDQKNQVLA